MTFSRVLSMIITLLVGLVDFPLTQNIEAAKHVIACGAAGRRPSSMNSAHFARQL